MSRKTRRVDKRRPENKKGSPIWLMLLIAAGALVVLYVSPEAFRSGNTAPVEKRADPERSTSQATNSSPARSAALDLPTLFPTNFNTLSDAEKAAFYQNLGAQLLQKQRFSDAIAQYRMAVKLNPQDEDTHYNLALALAKGGDPEGAKKEYLEALRIYPDYPEAHNNLGNLLLAEGKLEEAVTNFKAALDTTPDDPALHNNLGHALARQGKIAEAIPAFKDALRLKPDYLEARYNLGQAYLTQKEPAAASNEFSEILRTQPDFEPAQRGLARARQLQGP